MSMSNFRPVLVPSDARAAQSAMQNFAPVLVPKESDLPPIPSAPLGVARAAGNFGSGFLKGAGQTVNTISKGLHAIPYIGETLAPSEGIQSASQMETPNGVAQDLGVGAESLAEFLAGDETLKSLSLADKLKAVEPIADAINRYPRLATALGIGMRQGLVSAGQSALHGESPGIAAAVTGSMGAGGELAASMGAPSLAESALGVGSRLRGYGKTPGEAALTLTSGMMPEAVTDSAQEAIGKLNARLTDVYSTVRRPVSIQPALDILSTARQKAMRQNDASAVSAIDDIRKQLTVDIGSGMRLTPNQRATKVLLLKQGIGNQIRNWNPNIPNSNDIGLLKRVYGSLDSSLDQAAPQGAELNQKISSLIDVRNRAAIESRGAGGLQRGLHRVAAHTGAGAFPIAGGYAGYRADGAPGAAVGAAAGTLIPELIASPSGQMGAARALRFLGPKAGAATVPLRSLVYPRR